MAKKCKAPEPPPIADEVRSQTTIAGAFAMYIRSMYSLVCDQKVQIHPDVVEELRVAFYSGAAAHRMLAEKVADILIEGATNNDVREASRASVAMIQRLNRELADFAEGLARKDVIH
jgi:hypothetical protein